jgi:uncharacterized membrane protein (DUF2068 family)
MPVRSADKWIVLIGIFKLVKGVLLLAAGIGVLELLHKNVAEVVQHWTDVLRVDPDNRYIHSLIFRATGINDRRLLEISAGTFVYAGLFLTEGAGLLTHKRWAQYFTIIVTASFLPMEVYEFKRRATAEKAIVIVLNVATVIYLGVSR